MKIQFIVDTDNIVEFAEILNANEMENKIAGTTEDDQLMIDVLYNKSNRDVVEELEELAMSDDE